MKKIITTYSEKHFVVIALLFIVNVLYAQNNDNAQLPKKSIYGIARASQTEIRLRWAPDSYMQWRNYNDQGYIIQRVTVTKGGKVLSNAPIKTVTANAIKPLPLDAWETIAKSNKYAAITAMALYGKNFTVDMNSSNPATKLLNQAKEDEQRYTYCLFSCDQSYEVAVQAGLAYIDKEVEKDETYLYTIINVAGTNVKADTAFILTGIPEYRPLPAIADIGAKFGDKMVAISWGHKMVADVYSSYTIERSADGKNFISVNKEHFTPLTDKLYDGVTFYADSIASNNITFYYRIKGHNAFGEEGPYSTVVKGAGKNTTSANAALEKAEIVSDNVVTLEWTFPDNITPYIKEFKVLRAATNGGVYDTVYTGIKNTERKITLAFKGAVNKQGISVNKVLLPSNYMAIAATSADGSVTMSFPQLVQPVDALAPAAPVSATGVIDSATGKVTITWKPNTEDDLLGYRVFRANKKTEVLYQITSAPLDTAFFIDTVQVQSLNNTVYYKIVAVDKRFNMSAGSALLELKKPYVIKPSMPVFKAFDIKDKKINLAWLESNTPGVVKHVLYKKTAAGNETQTDVKDMKLVKTFAKNSNTQTFIDADITANTHYLYAIQAVSENGQTSDAGTIVVANNTASFSKKAFEIKNVKLNKQKGNLETNLSWDYTGEEQVQSFYIYRAIEGSPVTLLKIVSGTQKTYNDSQIEKEYKYTYAIRAILSSGFQTPLVNAGKISF